MSKKIYNVSIMVTTLVQADDAEHAMHVAKESFREVAHDTLPRHITVGVLAEITALTGLPEDWDGQCLPYGGDGNTRLDAILPERVA